MILICDPDDGGQAIFEVTAFATNSTEEGRVHLLTCGSKESDGLEDMDTPGEYQLYTDDMSILISKVTLEKPIEGD